MCGQQAHTRRHSSALAWCDRVPKWLRSRMARMPVGRAEQTALSVILSSSHLFLCAIAPTPGRSFGRGARVLRASEVWYRMCACWRHAVQCRGLELAAWSEPKF